MAVLHRLPYSAPEGTGRSQNRVQPTAPPPACQPETRRHPEAGAAVWRTKWNPDPVGGIGKVNLASGLTLEYDGTVMKSLAYLRRTSLFEEFREEDLEQIRHIFQEREFQRNQVVLMADETTKYMYVIKYGGVKVVQTTREGRENILAVHHAGSTFGEMALLDGQTTPATVVALEDSKVVMISKENFDRVLLKNPQVVNALIQLLCQRLRESWRSIQVLKYTDAETRLRHILLDLATAEEGHDPAGRPIQLKMTHQELAEMAGTSRETVSRLISRLQRQGLLRISGHRYLLVDHAYWREA